ncbi:MAG: hypothetical protein JSU86_18375 [Phycisphaerales bacterium]|nr:MAG: hypothetical protein JSU86_18375 [Phycisphaerales bacterium]
MSIELHCPQCQKLIRAPEDAGGKRGKCPYCENSVYIPMPADEGEEIPLAPIDDAEERRAEELRRESVEYAAAVDHVVDSGTGAEDAPSSTDDPGSAGPSDRIAGMSEDVDAFVNAMGESQLAEANAAAARLKRAGTRARDYVEGLLLDEMLPTYDNVPPPVVQGFLKTLLNRLG